MYSRLLHIALLTATVSVAACGERPPPTVPEAASAPSAPPTAASTPESSPPGAPPAADRAVEADIAHPALVFQDGQPRRVEAADLEGQGYTLIDLTDTWTPLIFAEFRDAEGQILPNRYRPIYIGLANEQSDGDGRPLDSGERNYFEVYGIPPTPRVVRARMLEDEAAPCQAQINYDLLSQVDRIPARTAKEEAAHAASIKRLRKQLEAAQAAGKHATIDALVAADASFADEWKAVQDAERRALAWPEIVKRLKCEGHAKANAKLKLDMNDGVSRDAIQSFQFRHKVYEYPGLRTETMVAFGKRPVQGNFEQFQRVMRERVADAAGILEDGTAQVDGQPATWVDAQGQARPVENLIDAYAQVAMSQMGVETPEKLLAFFQAHPPEDFAWLKVAVKLPPRPEYYSKHMDLDLVVDRGDVWYDESWNAQGELFAHSRERMPKLVLYATHNGQRFPLIKWPTTIGGWRAEQASNGYEYYRYKGSDVGKRVIRKIISGPTWVAPPSTPIRGLVKAANVNGKRQRIVNYDEMGPGYLSAYGLVAGYFVVPGKDARSDFDNGIRAHGSSDHLSITNRSKFSHGCHRLWNHAAVRLYDFLLNHRDRQVMGDIPLNASRTFYKDGEVFELRHVTRGFEFQLTPPLPVEVLEGRIRGRRQRPFEGYLPKPDVVYPPGPMPSVKGGGEP